MSSSASVATGQSDETVRPGAYQVNRTNSGPYPAQVYRVTVPEGVRPGADFTVHAGSRRVRVKCPPTSQPGQSLQITLPPASITHLVRLGSAPLTAAIGAGGGGAVAMSPDVCRLNDQAKESGGLAVTYLVTIPPNVYPGMQFTVNVDGQSFMVSCPPNAGPNMRVRIVPPVQREEPAEDVHVFEVAVPPDVQAGQPFALVANGQRVLVTCPPNVVAGQLIPIRLPISQVVGSFRLAYTSEKGGWKRTIKATDLKFQWDRLVEEVPKDMDNHFDYMKSAYVRKIEFLEGNDARMRTGVVELVPAGDAVVDSLLVYENRTLLSYADIATKQGEPFKEKKVWFENICEQLTQPWEDGHIKICIRRSHLLQDSVDAVMGLSREDLRKQWRLEFLGEPEIEAGGTTREWFELVTEQLFDPAFGLWLPSINNQSCVDINPASELTYPEDHLVKFRFTGRLIGRALFDRQLVKGHMVQMIYKHLLGWPITFEDVKAYDKEYYNYLTKLTDMEDVSCMELYFTVPEEFIENHVEKELVEDGAKKSVTNENLAEYIEASIKYLIYRTFNQTLPQLTELLLGFFDVIPEPALTVFDVSELEIILCGLPTTNMDNGSL